jgi:hypothetical protein
MSKRRTRNAHRVAALAATGLVSPEVAVSVVADASGGLPPDAADLLVAHGLTEPGEAHAIAAVGMVARQSERRDARDHYVAARATDGGTRYRAMLGADASALDSLPYRERGGSAGMLYRSQSTGFRRGAPPLPGGQAHTECPAVSRTSGDRGRPHRDTGDAEYAAACRGADNRAKRAPRLAPVAGIRTKSGGYVSR